MRKCVYCETHSELTKEHVISEAVLKELFGSKLNNIVSTKKASKWLRLKNHEETIGDVCRSCNSKLSSYGYDSAGKVLVSEINSESINKNGSFTFNQELLGWLLKTHLNLIRQKPTIRNTLIKPSKKLYESIISKKFDSSLFYLFIEGIAVSPAIWTTSATIFTGISRIDQNNIAISNMRINNFNTFLVIPVNGNYNNFIDDLDSVIITLNALSGAEYSEQLIIPSFLGNQEVKLRNLMPAEVFTNRLIPLSQYEALFEG